MKDKRALSSFLLYLSTLLLISLLFGIANNALRPPEERMGWFEGQEIIEVAP